VLHNAFTSFYTDVVLLQCFYRAPVGILYFDFRPPLALSMSIYFKRLAGCRGTISARKSLFLQTRHTCLRPYML